VAKSEADYWPKTLSRPGGKRCRVCIARLHKPHDACLCDLCQWFETHSPLQRWRIQACDRLGISPTGAKLLVVAEGVANLYDDPVPECPGKAWSYLAEKYDETRP
tara:strand:+ start:1018 stop:1332 length:315 start_codon:yes stop_codon:yes gene_type:complete